MTLLGSTSITAIKPYISLTCRLANVTKLSLVRGILFDSHKMSVKATLLQDLALNNVRTDCSTINIISTCCTHLTKLDLHLTRFKERNLLPEAARSLRLASPRTDKQRAPYLPYCFGRIFIPLDCINLV